GCEPGHGACPWAAGRHAADHRADAAAGPDTACLLLFRRLQPKAACPARTAAEGFIVTSLAPGVDDNKNLPGFLERWNAEVKRPPNGLPYLQYNYDSILIAARLYKYVLDKNQTPTGDTLREALLTIREFDGPLTGKTMV